MTTLRHWVHETAGGLPRQFWYVWATTLINRVGSFVLVLLAIYLTTERGLSAAFAGFVIGLWAAGGAVGAMIGGVLADRWGRKATMLTALYGSSALMLALGQMRGPVAIAVATFVLGMFSDGLRPATSALMVDIVPAADRQRAFSLNYWVINVGFAVASTAAGFLAGVDMRLLFVVDAATTLGAAIWATVKIVEPVRAESVPLAESVPRAESASRGGLVEVLRDRVFLGFVGVNMLVALVFLQHISTLPMSMTREGLSASTYGSVIAINGVVIVVGQIFVTRILRRYDDIAALALACVLVGVGFGLTAFASAPWHYAVAVLVWTLGEMFQAPSNATTVAGLSPAHLRGRYQGVFNVSWAAAGFLAPLVGGFVLQHGGKATLWLGCLALCLVAAALHLASRTSRALRTAELALSDDTTTVAPAPAA